MLMMQVRVFKFISAMQMRVALGASLGGFRASTE